MSQKLQSTLHQLRYEDCTRADADAAEQFAVAYVAEVGVSKETMIDAVSTLKALVMAYDRKLERAGKWPPKGKK